MPAVRRIMTILLVMISFVTLAVPSGAVEEQAIEEQSVTTLASKTVTVRVKEVYQMDPLDIGSSADFYWKVKVDGTWSSNSPTYTNQRDVILSPYWTYSKVVTYDTASPKKLVIFELWDEDGIWDDRCDINRTSSRNGAQIWLDMTTGTWNGFDDRFPGDDIGWLLNGNQDGTGPYPDPDDNDCWMMFDILLS